MSHFGTLGGLLLSCGLVWTLGACADEPSVRRVRPPGSLPESVNVPSAEVEVGTANGTLRKKVSVESFSITRFPITVAQYRECVQAGGCSPPNRTAGGCVVDNQGVYGQTYGSEPGERDEYPVTCTTPAQAAGFCHWVGGKLPTIEEWMHAARGPEVRRYSWTGSDLTCDRHPAALAELGEAVCCPNGCNAKELLSVGRHGGGKSPLGLEDVLLAPGELVAFHEKAAMPGCRRNKEGCVVGSAGVASIDSVRTAPGAKHDASSMPVWAFRCAWER